MASQSDSFARAPGTHPDNMSKFATMTMRRAMGILLDQGLTVLCTVGMTHIACVSVRLYLRYPNSAP